MKRQTLPLRGKTAKQTPRQWGWRLRLWCGMDLCGWVRLLVHNRFAVSPGRLHWLVVISLAALGNTLLRYLQELVWGRRIRETEIVQAPLFVLGHWRSGTTLLHELLTLDPNHIYPTTYECFFPGHFLLTERLGARLLRWLMPAHRPMDNVPMAWDRPLEDEYALCNLGLPSPYLTIAFPNHRPLYPEYLDLEQVPPAARHRWQQGLLRFLKQITVRNPKRIVLKSPPHTCRIKVLLDLFPDARFVYIVRDPYVVFPSTIGLWHKLYTYQGLHDPTFEGLEDYVFDNFVHMFDRLEEARPLVAPSRFYALRYEDLVRDPRRQLRALYEHLDLGDFEQVLPRLKHYLAATADYETNRYALSPALRDTITRRWGHVIRRYDYA